MTDNISKNREKELKKMLDEVLLANKPSKEEAAKVRAIVDEFISKVEKRKKQLGIKTEIMLGGSVAKGTFLKRKFDSDVFFRFSRSYPDENLSEMLEEILKPFKRNKLAKIHGSRDYFQMIYKGVNFELVPVYKITRPEQAVNVTDASPLHVRWVKSQLIKKAKIKDDIILAKMFCKAQGLYGAESYIQGFSGHVIDVLVIHSGGFRNLLKKAAKWKSLVRIDMMKHGSTLNRSKTYSPLILIDPVQPDRNASAALSREKFDQFKAAANGFLKNPSKAFFKEKKLSFGDLKDKAGINKLIIVKALPDKGKVDIIGCRLLKSFDYIEKSLKYNDFEIIKSGWSWDKKKDAIFWFIINDIKLGRYRTWIGPPLKSKKHVAAFRRKHSSTFEKDRRICATIRRRFMKPEPLVESCLKDDYIKQKVKRCRLKS